MQTNVFLTKMLLSPLCKFSFFLPLCQDVEKDRELRTELSREEIRQMIEKYNTLTKDLLKMTLVRGENTHYYRLTTTYSTVV